MLCGLAGRKMWRRGGKEMTNVIFSRASEGAQLRRRVKPLLGTDFDTFWRVIRGRRTVSEAARKNIVFALRAGWLQDVAQGARVKKLTNVSFWFGKSGPFSGLILTRAKLGCVLLFRRRDSI
jgi:hypothetical protein